jgi:hypothetical protein
MSKEIGENLTREEKKVLNLCMNDNTTGFSSGVFVNTYQFARG